MSFILAQNTGGGGGGGSPAGLSSWIQYNDSGSFGADSLATRNPSTKESTLKFNVSAFGDVQDNLGGFAVFRADTPGFAGNSISLVFDGVDDVATVVANWNAANPSNTVSVVQGNDTIVPDPQTVNLIGGGESGYELSLDLLGQGIEFTGSIVTDGLNYFGINGLLGSFGSQTPFIGAFDFGSGSNSQATFDVNNIDITSRDSSNNNARISLVGDTFSRIGYFPNSSPETSIRFHQGGIDIKNNNITWHWATLDGNPGDALVTDGAGNLSFADVTGIANLDYQKIGVGNSSNHLDGYNSFTYDAGNFYFGQIIPNNTGNGGVLTSPLSFGTASFGGSGVDDLTLTWGATNYASDKYGGNLTISIQSTGTPDTFQWSYTGSYSQVIGSGIEPITSGPIALNDANGNLIANVEFTNTTGHTGAETWTANTSLDILPRGMALLDGNTHEFLVINPLGGRYILGDDNIPSSLAGNGTRLEITDALGEMQLFAKRFLKLTKPGTGGYTAASFDFQNALNLFYGGFRALDIPTTTTWVDFDTANKIFQIGDVQSASTKTLLNVNVNAERILGKTDGEFIIQNTVGNQVMYVKPNDFQVTLGDVNGSSNDTKVIIDDLSQLITITNVPTYADDAAAIAAGLTTGQLYKTTTGGITSLNIVP